MSGGKVKLLRKYVKKKFRFDYDNLIKGVREEKLRYKIRFLFGLTKRLFFSKSKPEPEAK